MARIQIAELLSSRRAEDQMWQHGVYLDQLREAIWAGRYVVTPNRRDRAASHLLIGRDQQGRCLVAPIVGTDDPVVWRVITAWYCKSGEAAILRQRRQ
jgi:hypothetical protein